MTGQALHSYHIPWTALAVSKATTGTPTGTNNKKTLDMKALKGILGTAAFFAVLCLAGTADRTSEIIYTRGGETYEEIYCKLTVEGYEPSDREIAEYYVENY